jgi:hypothetical protein
MSPKPPPTSASPAGAIPETETAKDSAVLKRGSYTEKDWNVDSVPHVEQNGVESEGFHSYSASKTLAEQAFWSE